MCTPRISSPSPGSWQNRNRIDRDDSRLTRISRHRSTSRRQNTTPAECMSCAPSIMAAVRGWHGRMGDDPIIAFRKGRPFVSAQPHAPGRAAVHAFQQRITWMLILQMTGEWQPANAHGKFFGAQYFSQVQQLHGTNTDANGFAHQQLNVTHHIVTHPVCWFRENTGLDPPLRRVAPCATHEKIVSSPLPNPVHLGRDAFG